MIRRIRFAALTQQQATPRLFCPRPAPLQRTRLTVGSKTPVLVAGGGIGGWRPPWRWRGRDCVSKCSSRHRRSARSAPASSSGRMRSRRLMRSALASVRAHVRLHRPHGAAGCDQRSRSRIGSGGRSVSQAIQQSLRSDPSGRCAQVAARRRRGDRTHRALHVDARRTGAGKTSKTIIAIDAAGRSHEGVALIAATGEIRRAPAVCRRSRARVGTRGVSRRRRGARVSARPALERARGLVRAELPSGPLSAARRRPVQRGGDLPQATSRKPGA